MDAWMDGWMDYMDGLHACFVYICMYTHTFCVYALHVWPVCMHACVHTHIRTHPHIYTYYVLLIYIHTFIYVYIHTHSQYTMLP